MTEEAIGEHADISQALSDGNPAKAAEAMERHIHRSRARMAPFFEIME